MPPPVPTPAPVARQRLVDVLKAGAAQLILWHHLSAYGPLAEAAATAWPATMDWLYNHARMAVQVFLVTGGYLAYRHLQIRTTRQASTSLRLVWQRYLRLTVPLLVALVFTVLAALWARAWIDDSFVPDTPTWMQWVAHALLLHDLMDQEALSTGVWYVAIDFQLYTGLALCMWLGAVCQRPVLGTLGWLALTASSLFLFNRHPGWDTWGLYFFGAYGMGVAARVVQQQTWHRWGVWAMGAAGACALWVDFRARIALASTVALLLASGWQPRLAPWVERCVDWMSKTSYGLFLLHFTWLLVGNTVFERWLPTTPQTALATMLGVWLCSMASAHGFERWVEAPLARRLG